MSAENNYYLEVHASPQEVPLDPEGLLENLVRSSEEGGETVLDREVVPGNQGSLRPDSQQGFQWSAVGGQAILCQRQAV